MYEAPDRYKRMISARLPDGESLGLASDPSDNASTPLKDVQLISRAQLAPFFAAANIVAALMMVAAMHIAKTQSITHVGRSGRKIPDSMLIGEVVTRAIVWLSLPLYVFTSLQP